MKYINKNKYLGMVVIAVLMLFTSCNQLDDIDPSFRLDQGEAIVNAASAENVLNGVYIQLRDGEYAFVIDIFSKMGLTQNEAGNPDDLDLNAPQIQNVRINGFYNVSYRIVQEANLFIENVANVPADILGGEAAKNSFIAEARFLRGLAHFYLLRSFGQHYDTGSALGISLREVPAINASPLPRSSVSDAYASITADFQFAIDNCVSPLKYRANAVSAKALLAKVKLYEGNFTQAASLALDVIDNPDGRVFANPYNANFHAEVTQFGVESEELLFGPYSNDDAEAIFVTNSRFSSSIYAVIASADPRFGTSKGTKTSFGPNGFERSAPTVVHMRLSEVYLIHAEASARLGSGVDATALQSLNDIRTRAAVGLPALIDGVDLTTKAELLEAIRIEKLLELYTENGEEFFDLVRYANLDGLDPSTVKPTMTNPDFYILPIPVGELEIIGNEGVIVQNPGYPTLL